MRRSTPKSFLYVPGNRPDLFDKAMKSETEALILDLEDAVPMDAKDAARTAVTQWLSTRTTTQEVWVRIDGNAIEEDLAALTPNKFDGIMLAKAEPESLANLDAALPKNVPVIGLIESARGLTSISEMCAVSRVHTFGIGEVDLLADLRIQRNSLAATAAANQLRLQIVTSCAAAGLAAPVAPTSTDFRDLKAFATSTRELVDLGFRSRTAIHPTQCPIINETLTPSIAQVERSKDILQRLTKANGGPAIGANGQFIDAAVAREAEEALSRAVSSRPKHSNSRSSNATA